MIILDTIKSEDLMILRDWRNSDNVRPYCCQYTYLTDADMEAWYTSLVSDNSVAMLGIRKPEVVGLIGACGITRIRWRWRLGEITFYIGPRLYSTEDIIGDTLSQLIEYAFKTLNLHKLYWPVYSHNPYLPIYKKFFKEEAILRKEYYWDGKYYDYRYVC
jgi:RimJ/RimL family protein N-acetyltransferase